MNKAYRIHINGIVQGVGFRPFVYKLAHELQISGWVNNASDGVEIHAEGENVQQFYQEILEKRPPLSMITSSEYAEVPLQHFTAFEIVESTQTTKQDVLISPDVATCNDCLRELKDNRDRRSQYPFINCTNCGPRYSIIYDRPYDRQKTTMKDFAMCSSCEQEYLNPRDRRFHAQPVACEVCGPTLRLYDAQGTEVNDQGLGIGLLEQGAILAVKGLGGFHLVCVATHDQAVRRLRTRKERGAKPFALMARDIRAAQRVVRISTMEKEVLESPAAPIVLLPRVQGDSSWLSSDIAPGLHTLGVMLPYTPIHHLLFEGNFDFLVMTSANLSGRPLIYDNETAQQELAGIADFFLLHDRDIFHPCDDSVVQLIGDKMTFVRRARGYVPLPLFLKEQIEVSVAALGAEMKNAFCLASGKMAFMSQYIGDMHGFENFERFKQEYASYQLVTQVFPEKVAYDLHPEYATTKLAKVMNLPKCAVQHHHAHLASVMGEYKLTRPMLGLICDGTGYGEDAKIWGFEYLYGNAEGYIRKGHLAYLPLPGGDAGTKYPRRIAYAYLRTLLTEQEWVGHSTMWEDLSTEEKNILESQIKTGFQLFETSSAGRLFDAVSGLLGICMVVTYEGQAAVELESKAVQWLEERGQEGENPAESLKMEAIGRLRRIKNRLEELEKDSQSELIDSQTKVRSLTNQQNRDEYILDKEKNSELYDLSLEENQELIQIKVDRLFRSMVRDLAAGLATGKIAYLFHYSLACIMLETALIIGIEDDQLAVGGGVFQNKLLTEILLTLAQEIGIKIYYPQQLPAGDGGLAFGQVLIASAVKTW